MEEKTTVRIGISEEIPRENIFQSVKKRDGKVVTFDKSKISNAIYLAAKAVGGEDNTLADKLANEVILFLYTRKGSATPEVEEIQDAVEKVLIENGHARTAKAYILYRKQREILRKKKLLLSKPEERETTDYALFVRTSDDDFVAWDRERIIRALENETGLERNLAEKISEETEETILNSNVHLVSSSLIREIVNVKLIEHGLEHSRLRHMRLGIPLYDADKIILFANRENANIPHNPEATNMTIAETVKKQYMLSEVFSRDVADAHIRGDIHLHDLGFGDRPYCSGQSLEYVKKFGLNLPNALSIARPARHPDTMLAHMVKFSAALQGHFAGAIGWDAVNIFFAPFLTGMSDRDIHQLAQMMIFEYSQQSVARGGQAIFSDLNLYWEIPKHFRDVPAIGPGGEYTGKKYGDYAEDAQKFVWALFDVYMDGDGTGRPFFFPKPLVHITEDFFTTPGYEDFLNHISDVSSKRGNTYYVFDRGQTAKISECCRLSFKLEESDLKDAHTPWKMRYTALQNVTLNLPRAALLANGSDQQLYKQLDELLQLVVKAHVQKKIFIEKLISLKQEGPLALLTMERDGEPYLRLYRATFLVGLLGLNELVQYHTGREMHEDEGAFRFGLKVLSYLYLRIRELSKTHNIRLVMEQTPAESAAHRLARLDLEHFTDQASGIVKGDAASNSVYYTNSTYLNVGTTIDPITRVQLEGKFHDLIEAGALTHIWLGETQPPKESVANFVVKTFRNSRNAQIAFSPEFTTCNNCFKTTRGLQHQCPHCRSENVDHITRVTGYFTKVSGWNKGKKAELKDRYRSKL
ncbi:MAG: anaerobic ribonucleoside-triphosphate reductase [candidate division WOR-3 bacterium]|nr:MAG: anaerobic ribonucleoside-triphosphate reductase [candidate division WOR-3 bacterium]